MARIFTIEFNFHNKNYAAVVTVKKHSEEVTSFVAQLYDEVLFELAPEGKISFSTDGEASSVQNRMPSVFNELHHSVFNAIMDHLKKIDNPV